MSDLTSAQLAAVLGFDLSDEQWLAVSAGLDPAVIVAGAGSGKTTSMAARVAWLVGSGYARPDEVLGLTFTTKATAQLLTAMRSSLAALEREGLVEAPDDDADPVGEPQVLTYHAFSARILAEHGIRLGLEPGATMLADGARQQLAYRLVCRTSLPLAPLGRSPIAITSDLLALDDELTELDIDPERLREFDAGLVSTLRGHASLQAIGERMLAASSQREVLASLVGQWRAEKAERGYLDFADQIRLAGTIVDRYSDVVDDLRRRYRFVLLDEYQDTSISQRRLLQRAFGDGHSVMAVGDPCQAIYGWRGASVDNIDSFGAHFPASDPDRPVATYTLSENRRSGPAILEVANRTSHHLREVHPGVRPLAAGDNGKGPGRVTAALFDTYSAELDWLVSEVAATHTGMVGWREIAVLCATGKDVLAVDASLRRRGIPTQVVGAAVLLAQPAVIEVRSMLEVVHDPTANPAFVRLATGPRWRIDARDLAALGDRAATLSGSRRRTEEPGLAAALDDAVAGSDIVDSVSLTEALDDLGDLTHYSPEAVERFAAMAAELRALRRHVGEPLPELILRVLRTSGLEVEAALGPVESAAQQQHALAAFLDLAAGYTELDGRYTLGAFLSRLRDAERFDVSLDLDITGPSDAVQLLTVHKAKGLEFGYVFVPFVSAGAFPGGRGRAQWPTSASTVPWPLRADVTDALASFPVSDESPRAKQHDEYLEVLKELTDLENARLAYVAFTRAERGLAVSGHWWGPTQVKRRGPDRFLLGVREACLAGAGEVVHWAEAPDDEATNPEGTAAPAPMAWPAPASPGYVATLAAVAAEVEAVAAHQPTLPGLAPPVRAGLRGAQDALEERRIAEWDVLTAALLEEAQARQARERVVRLPDSVSASLLMRALSDPEAVAMDLARPMPHPPAPAARRGTEFHAWVESRYGQQTLLDPDDLPGAADHDIVSDEALARLKEAFEGSAYASETPVAVEAPFSVVVAGRVVNGRIDAVFERDGRYDVIDWKTGSARSVDPMQLALYRLAWAHLQGVPVDEVDAAFVMVATGEVVRPDTSAALAQLLGS